MDLDIILPTVTISQGKERYNLDWDYVSDKSNDILFEEEHFIGGYIEGIYDGLSDGKETVLCLNSFTGSIRNLSKENAEKLKKLISLKLHSFVQERQKEIIKHNNLPHIKHRNEIEKAQLN